MIKRYYYWGNLLLMGGLCLSACGNKNPGVSKEELRRSLLKVQLRRPAWKTRLPDGEITILYRYFRKTIRPLLELNMILTSQIME